MGGGCLGGSVDTPAEEGVTHCTRSLPVAVHNLASGSVMFKDKPERGLCLSP